MHAPPAFRSIRLRGDTDFSQTQHLDRWHEQGDVTFCFGLDVTGPQHMDGRRSAANSLETAEPVGEIPGQDKTPSRARGAASSSRSWNKPRLRRHSAGRRVDCRAAVSPCLSPASSTYRLVILRKNLQVSEPRQQRLFDDYRYFLYITDDWDSTPEEIVFDANDRCQQENVLAQLNAVRALHAPLDNPAQQQRLYADHLTGLEPLKAWFALCLPEPLRTQKGQAGRTETRTVDDGSFARSSIFLDARARPSRTNWPSIGGPSIGLERVAVCVPAIGRARLQRPLRC